MFYFVVVIYYGMMVMKRNIGDSVKNNQICHISFWRDRSIYKYLLFNMTDSRIGSENTTKN